MLTTVDILDQLKAKLGSDYKTARALDVTTQRISRMRCDHGIMTDEQGLKAAQILGLKEEFIIMSLTAERAQNSPAYLILKKIADKFQPKNMAAAVVFGMFLATSFLLPIANQYS